jgi:DNA-binding CsgD family transcriptional regulator
MTLSAPSSDSLERGRDAIVRRAWSDGYRWLSTADRETPLDPVDLERLATAAYLIGRDGESADLHSRAQQEFSRRGDAERAAQSAFWLGFQLVMSGDVARSAGWLARAERLLEDNGVDCVVRGYLLIPAGIRRSIDGDVAGGLSLFDQALGVGMRFSDPALVTMARHGQGRCLISLGQVTAGLRLLDEVMVAVTTGEISPIAVGPVYCSLLDSCQEILDWRRAQEWTEELSRWWSTQPEIVPFRGQCLVHRAEIKQVQGAWPSAMDEAGQACELLAKPPAHPAAGSAFYQQGELHRLRGEFSKAAESYRLANQHGRQPQPGLALLRLAQGQVGVAAAAIRRLIEERQDRPTRARVLAAYAEVMLAANDVEAARGAADRIAALCDTYETPFLRALCAGTNGAVLLAEGNAGAALTALHESQTAWAEVGAPYESACVRVIVALANRALGDEEMAQLELDAARDVFDRLGARPDVDRTKRLANTAAPGASSGLTSREAEVLSLIATGKTNRAIALELQISEKTVARHVSNIFTKLRLSSRAAATAYAYEHGLVQAPTRSSGRST